MLGSHVYKPSARQAGQLRQPCGSIRVSCRLNAVFVMQKVNGHSKATTEYGERANTQAENNRKCKRASRPLFLK